MIQRATVEENTPSPMAAESAPTPDAGTSASAQTADASALPSPQSGITPTEASTAGLIVDDSADQLQPGQMKKSDFLAQLRDAVCATTEEALKGTIWSAAGCPWVDHWFGYYGNRDSQQIERALRRYAPETANATSASDYIPIICGRVHSAIAVWSTTGEITGVPEGMELPGAGLMGAAGSIASGIASVGSSIVSGVESVASGIASAGASLVSGAGSALSSVGSMLFKGREGGAREAGNPQAIQGQLGSGRSLDGGVRSHMESAFGVDFSHVRVHTDATASGLSESLNARAFTVGQDVAFGAGEYRPGTLVGDALIAHELAHVVQQGGADSSEPMQKGETTYDTLEEDADRSAVGAMVSLWSGAKGGLVNVAQNAMPAMRSGVGLQRCAGAQKQSTIPTTGRQPTTARPPTIIANWGASVHSANAISDPTQKRDALLALVTQALSGTGIQVSGGKSPVIGGSGPLGEVNSNDYQAAPVLNFDLNLNRRTRKSNTERDAAHTIDNPVYFFTSGSNAYAIIGPMALYESSPDYTRMYAEHELYHTQHHVGSSLNFHEREVQTWTHDFLNNFHLLYRYRMQWGPLIDYYDEPDVSATIRQTTLDALVDYYNNPPVPATNEQGDREAFTQRLKRVFAKWLRRRLENPGTKSKHLIQDLEGRLHLGSSSSSQREDSSPAAESP